MKRNARKGFTLVELMVVILILSLLAAVIGVAVTAIIGENKAKLDAQSLNDFTSKVQVALNDKAKYIRSDRMNSEMEGKRSADLLVELFKFKVISPDLMKKLGGASGTPTSGEDFTKGAWGTEGANGSIIFTGPGTGIAFHTAMSKKPRKEWGVAMMYNKHFVNTYPDLGAVVLFSDQSQATVISGEQMVLETTSLEGDMKLQDGFTYNTADFYGSGVFKNVLPE